MALRYTFSRIWASAIAAFMCARWSAPTNCCDFRAFHHTAADDVAITISRAARETARTIDRRAGTERFIDPSVLFSACHSRDALAHSTALSADYWYFFGIGSRRAILYIEGMENWNKERLNDLVADRLRGAKLIVVSNREPYMHKGEGGTIRSVMPASGVTTALDPVLRAANGVWVAHGSGNADRRMVDSHDHVLVPPADPAYTLRR